MPNETQKVHDNRSKNVVLVDDDEAVRGYLSDVLTEGGYNCRTFSSGANALRWLAADEERVDLVLSDEQMPEMSGLDLLRIVKAVKPDLPFIIVSGQCNLPTASGALKGGMTDYLLKPVNHEDLLGLVSRHVTPASEHGNDAARAGLRRLLETLRSADSGRADELAPIFSLLGLHRWETMEHSRRVAAFALILGRTLGLTESSLKVLETASLLHDIGKIGIPHNVLMKRGNLTSEERTIVEMHPRLGFDLVASVSGMEQEAQIVYSHHEWFDGSGYPRGLIGEQIPLNARVFSVADTLDAITSNRCYREGESVSVARREIERSAETQFDPVIVSALRHTPDAEIERVRQEIPDLF